MIGDLDSGVLCKLALDRHDAYLRQAETDRTFKGLDRPGASLRARVALAAGDRLIALGLRLRRRYDPQLAAGRLYGRSSP
jgi:hypothetical protein